MRNHCLRASVSSKRMTNHNGVGSMDGAVRAGEKTAKAECSVMLAQLKLGVFFFFYQTTLFLLFGSGPPE